MEFALKGEYTVVRMLTFFTEHPLNQEEHPQSPGLSSTSFQWAAGPADAGIRLVKERMIRWDGMEWRLKTSMTFYSLGGWFLLGSEVDDWLLFLLSPAVDDEKWATI